ncbi:hypothetical protein, partial [Pantoea septica]
MPQLQQNPERLTMAIAA